MCTVRQFAARLVRNHVLWLALSVQAGLLFARLDLLPVWGDEHFTLSAASRPLPELLREIEAEQNNPPLHTLLVHFWLALPWPCAPLPAARALSALFALFSTLVIDRLWLKPAGQRVRVWFLLLWCLSPCNLLYARIARSYTPQVLLFAVAVWAVCKLLGRTGPPQGLAAASLSLAAVLYTHYLPGLALLAATLAVGLWSARRCRDRRIAVSTIVLVAVVAAAVAAWMPPLAAAVERILHAPPSKNTSPLVEFARVAYVMFSCFFGETAPTWALALAPLLIAGALWLTWRGLRERPAWSPVVGLSAALAYVGAGRWVSFVFTPARLLFLFPFALLLAARGAAANRRAGTWICLGLAAASVGSAGSYFRKTDYLNKAYLIPYGDVAAVIRSHHAAGGALLVADACNTDPAPLAALLGKSMPVLVVGRESTLAEVRERVARSGASVVWMFRNTHDTSPGGLNRALEQELAARLRVRQHLFVPYSERDRWFMRLLGWSEQPSHLIQLTEFRGN